MKVILPVAGKGTRLRPHTISKAKSLVQVAGKTVLEHIVSRLSQAPVTEYIFITDENGGQIEEFMKRSFPALNCHYIVQKERLGPAHAVALAAPRIAPGDDVLVVFNDTIFVADLGRIPQLCSDCDGLIYSKEVEDYQRFGVNVVAGEFIVDMVEKPDTPVSRLAQVGLYYLKDGAGFMGYLERTIAAGETVKGEYYLPAVFMRMIADGLKFRAPEIDAWLDCGKPETLLETNRYLLEGRHHCHGEVVDSVLIEPVHIGYGVTVRNSIIGPYVSVATGSVVENSVICDSIINANSTVRSLVLEGSILGDAVTLAGSPRRMNIGDHSLIEMEG
ncbi:sugar phosphate nucleotidyltransferase [Desulfuromonas carbonis]|uniref:sugar phosphate nucleotidyltransferase n=1 Tax=Desulfuromonas sp. DDH964 TaxID=1823759 RepID=UPI00078E5F4F|nr:sugar phosphate nucleotidyltransferase [Desulfuromonas sp. DDH964]AMV73847.1 Bifunctional protein GlmU [Desulfuromonas sp. DDH964]